MPEHDPERSSLSSVSDYEDADDHRPTAFIKEETPLLQSSDEDTTNPVSVPGALSVGDGSIDFRTPRVILTRTLKSVVLIAKVCHILFVSSSTLW